MTRIPPSLMATFLGAAAVAAGLLWHLGEFGTDRADGPTVITQGQALIGADFALTDQNGRTRHAADFRGRFMLVYFGYSNCPDVCPATLAVMQNALERLGPAGARIVPIFISVDPARDTPAVLKAYLKAFGPRFVGLTGDGAAVAAAERAWRVYVRKEPLQGGGYAMDHSSQIYLMGPDGKFLADYEESLGPDALAAALKAQL